MICIKYFYFKHARVTQQSVKQKRETARDKTSRQDDERRVLEGMKEMSVPKASIMLHLPKDFKKEFNGTTGYP